MFTDKRRGDVYWAAFTALHPQDSVLLTKTRPVLVVSSDRANMTSNTVLVIPLTSSPNALARGDGAYDQVLLTGYNGTDSMALTRQLHAVDITDLSDFMYHLTEADMVRVNDALHRALGL